MFKRKRIGIAVAVALAVAAGVAAPAASASARATSTPESMDLEATVDPAAVQLAETWSVSLAEAQRRIDQQAPDAELAEELSIKYPEQFAGGLIDQAEGGQLVIRATSWPEGLTEIIANHTQYVGSVRLKTVRFSSTELVAVAARLKRLLPTSAGMISGIDVRSNTVLISTNADTSTARETVSKLVGSESSAGVSYENVSYTKGGGQLSCTNSGLARCDPPTRGGTQIGNATGDCTLGLNAVSKVNSQRYYITAGHCLDDDFGNSWFLTGASGTNINIGTAYTAYNTTTQDYGVIQAPVGSTFPGFGRVLVQASTGGGHPTVFNDNYQIATTPGSSSPLVGSYICKTGAYGGTGCGTLLQVGWTEPVSGETNLGRVRFDQDQAGYYRRVACHGDSGAPVYVGGSAFGILTVGEGPVVSSVNGSDCYGGFGYMGLASILASGLNVKLVNPN